MEGNKIAHRIAELKKQLFEKAWFEMSKCENLKKHLVYVGTIHEDEKMRTVNIEIERAIIIGRKTTYNWEDFAEAVIPNDAESDVKMFSEDDAILLTENGFECKESEFSICDNIREVVYDELVDMANTWYKDELVRFITK